MIIDRIVIENFGVYSGRNEAVLSPPDIRRPVTLFGGNNGAGKTTLLKALFLAFYGKRAPLADRNGGRYEDYLAACIHDEAPRQDGARIEVHFRKVEEGKECQFQIVRRWWYSSKGLEERLEVYEHPDVFNELLTDTWDEFIEDYLPARIANLFFFDGEQIKNLADPERAAQLLRTAVQSLLGLEIIDRLANDLLVLERRKKTAAKSNPDRMRIEVVQKEINDLTKLHEDAILDKSEAEKRLCDCRVALEKAEERYLTEGGELSEQRGALKEEKKIVSAELHEIEEELRKLAAGPLPLALVTDLLDEVICQAEEELNAKTARDHLLVMRERDKALLGFLKNTDCPVTSVKSLSEWLEADVRKRSETAESPIILDVDLEELEHVQSVKSLLPTLKHQAASFCKKHRACQKELDRIERRLEQAPDEEKIAALHAVVEQHRRQMHEAQAALAISHAKAEQIFRELTAKQKEYGRILEEHAGELDAVDSDRRILVHAAKARETLERFRKASIQRRVGQLEKLICDSFSQLIRKQNFVQAIRISPEDFSVHLVDPKGREIPMARLSAGEAQLLATAMLWGLARASGRIVPTFIDTPLGRLDSSHRRHLVERYFPTAAHQVVLLSTDKEIDECHLEQLKPHIGNMYRLNHDAAARATNIEKGYLFE